MGTRTGLRILIVRLSAIGDVIHGVPVLCALRRTLPNAFLGWVVEGRAGQLLEGHPALDELIRIPRGWLKSPRTVWELRHQLRRRHWDVTVDLQCLTKSAIAAWISGAPRRLGVAGPDGRELSKWFHNELVEVRAVHVIEHYLQIAAPLGIDPTRVEFQLPERAEDAQTVEAFLDGVPLRDSRYALLNPGAGHPSKIWPADRYGELAQYLGLQRGIRSLVVWAGPAERAMAEWIVANSAGHAVLAPETTLCELAAFCRRAALCVGSDTGPVHLAVAVGTPSVSLHGNTRAEWSGAYGPANRRIQAFHDAGTGLSRAYRKTDNRAMKAIRVSQVTEACNALLT